MTRDSFQFVQHQVCLLYTSVPWAALVVTKVVVGDPPADDWSFGGTLGSFTLPAVGGEQIFSLNPGDTVIVSETDRPGWAATVACAPGGETGIASVTLTPAEAVVSSCIFTNTLCQPGYYDNGTICKAVSYTHLDVYKRQTGNPAFTYGLMT